MTTKKITRNQLVRIAAVGLPYRIKELVVSLRYCKMGILEVHGIQTNCYRLYDRGKSDYFFAINYVPERKFIQFQVGQKEFNHYAALKEMEKMGLI